MKGLNVRQLGSTTALALLLAVSACTADLAGPPEPSYQMVDGSLQIIKRVVNDNGGTATPATFGVNTSAGALTFDAGVPDGPGTLRYSSQVITVAPGQYTLRENNVVGYTEGTWSCTGATPDDNTFNNGAVTVPSGTAVVCTITNDDATGTLRLVKRVVNDHGGAATVADFGLSTSAGALTFAAGVADGPNTLSYVSQAITVLAGQSYTLRENDIAGYTEGVWTCEGATPSNNTISAGAVTVPSFTPVICTITNDDIVVPNGSLRIVKRVVNDNGGTATVAAFGVSSSAGTLTFGAGVPDGPNTLAYSSQTISVAPGLSYTLRENDFLGYLEGTWSCTGATPSDNTILTGAVTVPSAVDVVCTITNDDATGTLQLVKRVVNDNGGTATVAAFGLSTSAGALTFGPGLPDGTGALIYASQAIPVASGVSYTLRENDIAGYAEGVWTCEGATPSNNTISAGAVTVLTNTPVVCTITNNDVPPVGSLRIVKRVVNDNGLVGTVAAFGLNTSAGALTFGSGVADGANTLAYSSQTIAVAAGSYTLRENNHIAYTEGTWSCTGATPSNNTFGAGMVTVPAGVAVVCTITNNDRTDTLLHNYGRAFWATNSAATYAVWFNAVGDRSLCNGSQARNLDNIGKLMGGFLANPTRRTTGATRSSLDQARMQLLPELLAAILNNAATGTSPSGPISVTAARAAYCGTNITTIQNARAAMAAFNGTDDGSYIPNPYGNGWFTPNLTFWNTLP
jgi:hypothetical protein